MAQGQTIAALEKALKASQAQMAELKDRQAKAAAKLRKATAAQKKATELQEKATAAEAKAQAALNALDDAIVALAGSDTAPKAAPKPKKAAPAKKPPAKKAAAPKKAAKAKAPSTGGLAGVLVSVLTGKTGIGVGEAAKLVLATGYKTKSSQFNTIVNQTLLRDTRFIKVDRGVYALEGTAQAAAPKAAAPKKAAKPKKAAPKAAAPKKTTGKAPAAGSLKSLLIALLKKQKTIGIAEAAAAVLATGYKSAAKNFKLNVNQMLAKNPAFKQVGRGLYALK